MMSSTFIASAIDDGSTVVDEQTLILKYFGGTLTLNFSSPKQMEALAHAILIAVDKKRPVTPASPVVGDQDSVHSDADADADADADEKSVGSNHSTSESEPTSPPPAGKNSHPETPESSFESYDGHGMTQECFF